MRREPIAITQRLNHLPLPRLSIPAALLIGNGLGVILYILTYTTSNSLLFVVGLTSLMGFAVIYLPWIILFLLEWLAALYLSKRTNDPAAVLISGIASLLIIYVALVLYFPIY